MTWLRSLAFQAAFHVWTAGLGLLTLPVLLLPRPAVLAVARLWIDGTFWLLARIVGLTYEIRGTEHRAPGPAIYAIKHQSAWDTLFLMRLFRDPAIVMKEELAWVPFVGWYLVRLGMIRVDRRAGAGALRRMVRMARARIAEGRDVVVFPEGTRTAPGQSRPYRPGIAALYAALDRPVVPVALNSGLYWARRAFTRRPGRIVVALLPSMPPGLGRESFMAGLRESIETQAARCTTKRGRGRPDAAGRAQRHPLRRRPSLVVAHGLFGSARNWSSVARRLAVGRTVHALDMRNHGASPWTDEMTYPAMAEDLLHYVRSRGCRGRR